MAKLPMNNVNGMANTTEKVVGSIGGKSLYGKWISEDNIIRTNSDNRDVFSYALPNDVKAIIDAVGYFVITDATNTGLIGQKFTIGGTSATVNLLVQSSTELVTASGVSYIQLMVMHNNWGALKASIRVYVTYVKEDL